MLVLHDADSDAHDPSEPQRFEGRMVPPAETARRSARILEGLAAVGGFEVRRPAPVARTVLATVHDEAYLDFLATAHRRWRAATGAPPDGHAAAYVRPVPGMPSTAPDDVLAQFGWFSYDADPVVAGTWDGARASAAAAVGAADAVLAGAPAAYALCRPPGHHATTGRFGGYCFLNNAALAARRIASAGHRVAVLDVDVHHGNGTQQVFDGDPDVLTVSVHGDPTSTYPFFAGYAHERGAADANRNLPLPRGTTWAGYAGPLSDALGMVAAHGTDVLVVALGVDADVVDGVFALVQDDFARMGEVIASAGPALVVTQEGGYGPGALERDVPAFLGALA